MSESTHPRQWYYNVGSERKGPSSTHQMEALLDAGAIGPATLVWTTGMAGWDRLDKTPLASRNRAALGHQPPALPNSGPRMSFSEAVSTCFSKYATFSGRAGRPEFWYFFLFTLLAGLATLIIDVAIFSADSTPFNTIFSLAVLLPSLAVGCRRLHDTDRSGWWQLLALVPLIGIIVLIIFWAQKGTPGPNKFG